MFLYSFLFLTIFSEKWSRNDRPAYFAPLSLLVRRSWKYKFSLRVVRLTNTPHCDRLLRCAPRLNHSDVSIIENINISFRSRYIKSCRIGSLNIDFFSIHRHAQILFLRSIIYSLTVMPITKNSVTTVYRYLTILRIWYFANDIQYLQLNSNLR